MNKPRIFLGSSAKQADLLEAIAQGLADVVEVEPWMTTFNPGRSTLDRFVELSQQVDFAGFVFAQDDWATTDVTQSGHVSPRDNVVFEAGLSAASRHPAHVHPPPGRFEAAERPARADLCPLRPGHGPGGGRRNRREAPEGDRE
jgi:hypothetical protein